MHFVSPHISHSSQSKSNLSNLGLFIDFENLIYGLTHRYGEQGAFEKFDLSPITKLCQEHGRVIMAKAYADWRMKSINRFQSDLYAAGVELIHVLSRGQKNAVDVYLAVDIVEMALTLQHLDVFVIVSGDRDFVRALQVIRKYQKKIIVIAPKWSLSPDLKALCDEFISYEQLLYQDQNSNQIGMKETQIKSLESLKKAIFSILTVHDTGLTGAQLHQQLERFFDGRFDPKEYGFVKFSKLLEQLEDDIDLSSEGAGDMLVRLKENFDKEGFLDELTQVSLIDSSKSENRDHRDLFRDAKSDVKSDVKSDTKSERDSKLEAKININSFENLQIDTALESLKQYRYEQDVEVRRPFLSRLFEVLYANENLSWQDLSPVLAERLNVSKTYLNKYHALLWQSQCFELLGEDLPVKERSFKLADHLESEEKFIEHYERSILLKASAFIPRMQLSFAMEILGLHHQMQNEYSRQYVSKLLEGISDIS
jgi:hypothetical protein